MSERQLHRLDLPIGKVESQIKDIVAEGGVLAAAIVRQWAVNSIWTGVESGVEPDDLTVMRRGGLKRPSRLNTLVIAFMRQFLEEHQNGIAVFEDAVARVGDPTITHTNRPYVQINGDVLPILTGGRHNLETVRNLLLDAWSWRLLGVLTHSDKRVTNHHIDESISNLVAHASNVIVGAWDGEGVVVIDRA